MCLSTRFFKSRALPMTDDNGSLPVVVLFALVEPAVSAAARAVASVPEPHALPPQAAAQALTSLLLKHQQRFICAIVLG